jgi:hemolysin III
MEEKKVEAFNTYAKPEEIANAVTHGLGALLSIPAMVLMLMKASAHSQMIYLITTLVYALTLTFLYTSSTLYHSVQNPKYRNRLNVMDHLAIYLLIAGTYTPFTLLALPGITGWMIFAVVWLAAIAGIVLKYFYFGKHNVLSTIAYVVMGSIIVVAIKPLYDHIGMDAIKLLLWGGVSYIVGAGFYLWRKLPYNHAIFHLFVLGGSLLHFLAVYFYVL